MTKTEKERWDEIVSADESVTLRIELARRFLRDYPEAGYAWWALGDALARISQFDEAEAALYQAMRLCPPRSQVFLRTGMGKLYRNKGDDAVSEQWYRRAIEGSPDDAQGYIYLGCLLSLRGRFAEAEQLYRQAIKCSEGCIDEAWYNLGLLLRASGKYAEAIECFEQALQRDPQYKAARLAKRDVEHAMRIVQEEPL